MASNGSCRFGVPDLSMRSHTRQEVREEGDARTLPGDLPLVSGRFGARGRAVRLAASDPCTVLGDERALRSAVENIVRNAIRYTPEGRTAVVTLLATNGAAPPAAELCVRDHGPGVPEEALSDLFQPFYRVADARDRDSGAVRLGLAIAERAVALHGGAISAANAAGGGLVMTLRLPLSLMGLLGKLGRFQRSSTPRTSVKEGGKWL